jgi:hypothetical protein
MDFDFTKQRFRSHINVERWADVGGVAGAFANVLVSVSLYMRVPAPMHVRRHLGKIGGSCTDT